MDHSTRIGLLDADSDVRFGRRMILESDPGLEIVYESEGKIEDLSAIAEGLIDVLVIDQKLSSGPGVSFYRELSELTGIKQAPSCVITSSFDQPELTFLVLETGIEEVVTLEQGAERLIQAVSIARSGSSSMTLESLHELLLLLKPNTQLDLNFVRVVDELPERLASNLRRLRQVWSKIEAGRSVDFEPASMSNLIDRLPVRTLAQLIIKLHRSELLNG
jgi:DNA-binding NarL/FixJ family response regulator